MCCGRAHSTSAFLQWSPSWQVQRLAVGSLFNENMEAPPAEDLNFRGVFAFPNQDSYCTALDPSSASCRKYAALDSEKARHGPPGMGGIPQPGPPTPGGLTVGFGWIWIPEAWQIEIQQDWLLRNADQVKHNTTSTVWHSTVLPSRSGRSNGAHGGRGPQGLCWHDMPPIRLRHCNAAMFTQTGAAYQAYQAYQAAYQAYPMEEVVPMELDHHPTCQRPQKLDLLFLGILK